MIFTVPLKDPQTFKKLYFSKKSAVQPAFVLYAGKNNFPVNRLGVTASTKLGGAVQRNRMKRRLKELYRLNESFVKHSFDITIIARNRVKFTKFTALSEQFIQALKTLDIYDDKMNSTDA